MLILTVQAQVFSDKRTIWLQEQRAHKDGKKSPGFNTRVIAMYLILWCDNVIFFLYYIKTKNRKWKPIQNMKSAYTYNTVCMFLGLS